MKSLKLTEAKLKSILSDYIKEEYNKRIGWMANTREDTELKKEGLYDNDGDQSGAVEVDKKTNPMDIKKYTSQGMDVKLVDENKVETKKDETNKTKVVNIKVIGEEQFGEEQPAVLKHKFENRYGTEILNIYSSKEGIKISDIMNYILTIKNQLRVHQALASKNALLYIKDAPSGRYIGPYYISEKLYDSYLNLLKKEKGEEFAQKKELNENLIKLLKLNESETNLMTLADLKSVNALFCVMPVVSGQPLENFAILPYGGAFIEKSNGVGPGNRAIGTGIYEPFGETNDVYDKQDLQAYIFDNYVRK